MVGIVGILLLGSLAWSAVGALMSAVGAASAALTSAAGPRPVATFETVVAVTPTLVLAVTPTVTNLTPTVEPTRVEAIATATPQPTAVPSAAPTAAPTTVVASGRNPWILLPQPQPGSTVQPGSITLEARGRGDAPITAIALQLDGSAVPVQLEQRSESTWRGVASAHVSPGPHSVRATVTDADGRSGSFRWSFTAGSGP